MTNENRQATIMNIPDDAIETLTVEDIYNKENYDLSTMEIYDVFQMLK